MDGPLREGGGSHVTLLPRDTELETLVKDGSTASQVESWDGKIDLDENSGSAGMVASHKWLFRSPE